MAEVLSVPPRPEGQDRYSPATLPRSSPPQSSFLVSSSPRSSALRQRYSTSDHPYQQHHHIDSPAAQTSTPSLHAPTLPTSHTSQHTYHQHKTLPPSAGSNLTLDQATAAPGVHAYNSDELSFPSYDDVDYIDPYQEDLEPPASPKTENSYTVPSSSGGATPTPNSEPEHMTVSEDDSAARQEPSRHVDYLSHDWREEDIWSSWRHIVSKRKVYGERSRLENASWRTWAKSKYRLRTVTPEKLNWLKDCDVTWLYGPLQTNQINRQYIVSELSGSLSKNNSFLTKKPILKKRSVSELMLQKSLSSSSLVKQAAASVQAQQWDEVEPSPSRTPSFRRSTSDFEQSVPSTRTISRETTETYSSSSTSGLQSPSGERKRIRFDEKVEQCIAVDVKEGEDDEDDAGWNAQDDDSSDDDDDGIVLKSSKARRNSLVRHSRSSSFSESRTIAKLPATTLKYRNEEPCLLAPPSSPISPRWNGAQLSPSPSQETIRPSHSRNYILEEDDDAGLSWEPSDAFRVRREAGQGLLAQRDGSHDVIPSQHTGLGAEERVADLRRTSSGMFMPFETDEADLDEDEMNAGFLGRVVDTVNTAKDIAHVIWNVGWRK